MRNLPITLIGLLALSGCATPEPSASSNATPTRSAAAPATAQPQPRQAPQPATPAPKAKRAYLTAQNNPTTLAGRGEPSLEEADRPAAWIFIDGKNGKFREREGRRMIQWVIEEPVGEAPTFRVEGYDPLLGEAKDFKAVLQSVDATGGAEVMYKLIAREGSFSMGTDYPLLNPGDNFVIRNGLTGDVVREIAPLAPGTYAIAAGLKNNQTKKEAAAVTYFTVP
jgi:hypothetical protein